MRTAATGMRDAGDEFLCAEATGVLATSQEGVNGKGRVIGWLGRAAISDDGTVAVESEAVRDRVWVPWLMALGDAAAMVLAVFVGYLARYAFAPAFPVVLGPGAYEGLIAAVLALPVGFFLVGLYPGYGQGPVARLRKRILVIVSVFAGLIAADYLFQDGLWSNGLLLPTFAAALVLSPLFEAALAAILKALKCWGTPVVVIGAGGAAEALMRMLRRETRLGYVPVACFDDDQGKRGTKIDGVPVMGPVSQAKMMVDRARTAIVVQPERFGQHVAAFLDDLPFPKVIVVPDVGDLPSLWVSVRDLGGIVGLEVGNSQFVVQNQLIKRALDLVLGVLFLLASVPVILVLAAAVKLVSPGPALFAQVREGWGGRAIRVWKLRTMHPDAEERLERHLAGHPRARAEWGRYMKLKEDPRLLPGIGRFMRRWSLDELPQFWNVVRGDMSLVGPRAFPEYHLQAFDPEFRAFRRRVRPGITCLWQVEARSNGGLEVQRKLDSYYIRNRSLWLDLYLLGRTVGAVLKGNGAH